VIWYLAKKRAINKGALTMCGMIDHYLHRFAQLKGVAKYLQISLKLKGVAKYLQISLKINKLSSKIPKNDFKGNVLILRYKQPVFATPLTTS
jgi:hypothetical protein